VNNAWNYLEIECIATYRISHLGCNLPYILLRRSNILGWLSIGEVHSYIPRCRRSFHALGEPRWVG